MRVRSGRFNKSARSTNRFVPSHVHNDAVEPAQQVDSQLALRCAVIVPSDDRAIEIGYVADLARERIIPLPA